MKTLMKTGALALTAAGALALTSAPAVAQQHFHSGGGMHYSGTRGSTYGGGARYSGYRGGYSGYSGGYRGSWGGRRDHDGDRWGYRSGFGWGWWGPGIVLSFGGGYPYYGNSCMVWSPYYGTYVRSPYCNYPYYDPYYYY